jgi:hypothetical protein
MLFLMKAGKNRTARWRQNIDLPEAVQLPSIFDRLSAYVLVGFGRFLPSDYQSKKVSMFQWPTSEAPARCAPRFEDRPTEHRDRRSPMIQIVLQHFFDTRRPAAIPFQQYYPVCAYIIDHLRMVGDQNSLGVLIDLSTTFFQFGQPRLDFPQ